MENNSNIHDTNDSSDFNENMDLASNQFKLPPHSLKYEEVVLNYLVNNEFSNLLGKIKAEYFYSKKNQIIFQAILKLYLDKSPIDIFLLKNQLSKNGDLSISEDLDYLQEIFASKQIEYTIEEYIYKLSNYNKKRKLICMADDLNKLAYEDSTDIKFLVNLTGKKITELKEER